MNAKDIALGIVEYNFPEKLAKSIKNKLYESDMFEWTNSGVGLNEINTSIRSSKNYQIDHEDILIKKIKKYIYECTDNYCSKYSTLYTQNVDLGILKYNKGGKYLYHHDSDYIFYRTISVLIYLNPDEYTGGETHFKFLDVKIKPESPKLVLFPSNFIYNHAALPVIEGEKYVIVGWMNDRPKEV